MNVKAGALITANLDVRLLNRRENLGAFPDLKALRDHLETLDFIPAGDTGDFGRGGPAVRRLILAALLTAGDYGSVPPESTGIIGWNGDGCAAENRRFWDDYSGSGRESGRGGLFVATLPTIPFCEAAITLGCHGPCAYLRTADSTGVLRETLDAFPRGMYLVGETGAGSVCLLLVDSAAETADLPDLPDLRSLFAYLEGKQ